MVPLPRNIQLCADRLVVHLTGLTHFESLTGRLDIPYGCIRGVWAGAFTPPSGTLRLGGTSVPFTDIREGHVLHAGSWYFLSYEDHNRTVALDLDGFSLGRRPYTTVVLGADDPEALAAAIERGRAAAAGSA